MKEDLIKLQNDLEKICIVLQARMSDGEFDKSKEHVDRLLGECSGKPMREMLLIYFGISASLIKVVLEEFSKK